jgi:cytochrome c oxidase subunit 4
MSHSDPASVQKAVRTYMIVGAALYVGTILTVAVNQVHLVVPMAITVALIIASLKGSLVASIFMHLSNEKRWIYGSLLLTVVFFVALIFIPLFTVMDTIGKANPSQTMVPVAEHSMEH